jgi:DNA repair exonuclease SbcCD ATPase subunit
MRELLKHLPTVPRLIVHSLLYGNAAEIEEIQFLHATIDRLQVELKQERDPNVEFSLANQLAFAASLAGEQAGYADKFKHELEQARVELKRWDRRWELARRVIKRLRAERDEARDEVKQLGKDAGAFHAALQEIAEIIECGSVGAREVPGKVRELITGLRDEIEGLVDEIAAMVDADTAEGLQRVSDEMDVAAQRDAARAEIARVGAQRATLLVELGQARTETEKLQKKLDKPCGQCHPCTNWRDETWRQADRRPPHVHEYDALVAELEQLREDLAHARNQLPVKPGQTVTLHFEDGKTTTGQLVIHQPNDLLSVNGWLVDVPGRTLIRVSDGGAS